MQSSQLADQGSGAGAGSGGGEDCRTREFIAKFEVVVVFDAAPVPVTGTEEGEAASVPTEEAEAATTEAGEGTEGG